MLRNCARLLIPSLSNALLALAAALILVFSFPDFEVWFLAWIGLSPLLIAIEREKASSSRSFVLGWLFGTAFFFGTCWWLTFAPITYAAFPPLLAYALLVIVCVIVGIFPAFFAAIMSFFLRRFGIYGSFAAPFAWVFTEFARYWMTGNNWNALGYSQAFFEPFLVYARYGGVLFVSFICASFASAIAFGFVLISSSSNKYKYIFGVLPLTLLITAAFLINILNSWVRWTYKGDVVAYVVALQPNVPMSGLTREKWDQLRQRHVRMAEKALLELRGKEYQPARPITVIFPESPMNFMYEYDAETKTFIDAFASQNNVNVLFNSAEPNHLDGKFFNSAVMVGPESREIQQYDKIYLVPFGEAVPFPLEGLLPGFVGNFSYGSEHRLFPLGEAKAGVMICFESHFGELSRQYVRNGADVIIEMTNDGYLGPTPVLRQHLANAVFRAVESKRPLLRVTNVGITAYINEGGEILNPAPVYQEDFRIWTVSKSDGGLTFFARYGDWLGWICTLGLIGAFLFGFRKSFHSGNGC